jgi:hypothetical protein
MLIVNADDWGKNKDATDKSLECFKKKRITSSSAMLFMEDSERSAKLAQEVGVDVGLHLNFTHPFHQPGRWRKLEEHRRVIGDFLGKSRYRVLFYHPLLRRQFDYVFKAQYDEFMRLYKRRPAHINGHQHMHLCMNMIVGKVIPQGLGVRRNFYFARGEKDLFNRSYRFLIDQLLLRWFKCTDFFFSIRPIEAERIKRILEFSKTFVVELMVHPEKKEDYQFLMSDEYGAEIRQLTMGNYTMMEQKENIRSDEKICEG